MSGLPKTRFAPSPTGLLHLGNIRTALFSFLLAQHLQGHFLLRIEDTDRERSKPEYATALQHDLQWLQLQWQEGPFWQAERQSIYDQYYDQLQHQGLAYPCFCSEQQLAITRKVQLSQGKPPRYAGTCRHLTAAEVTARQQAGETATLRFAVPPNQTVSFEDLVRGTQQFQTHDLGDFVIRRTDGTAPFLFCNAIDDALMGVTHVLRGEDHIANTPRQLLILQALHLSAPHYGHINLIIGKDNAPLSKRQGSRSIQELQAAGFLPAGINNYLARLGHYYESDRFMTLSELAEQFAVDKLGKAPAKFDEEQLLHWQKEAVLHLSATELWQWLGAAVHAKIPAAKQEQFLHTVKANIVFPQDALHWAEIFFGQFKPGIAVQTIIKTAGAVFFQQAMSAVEQQGADFQAVNNALAQALNLKGKALFQPLRAALTGELHGPEMAKIFELLGVEELISRLQQALAIATDA